MTNEKEKLENGTEVTINIPFTYEIGEEGYNSGKVLNTIKYCKDEVMAEIEVGHFTENADILMEVSKIEKY